MQEIWKPIKNFENYEVSNLGNVRSLDHYRKSSYNSVTFAKGKVLKPRDNGYGYLQVGLMKDGKHALRYIHRLVYETFVAEIPKGFDINHKDENKANNCLDNLEILSHKDNCNYGTRNERSAAKQSKPVMCIETGQIFKSAIEASRYLGLANSAVTCCCLRGSQVKNTHWKYLE